MPTGQEYHPKSVMSRTLAVAPGARPRRDSETPRRALAAAPSSAGRKWSHQRGRDPEVDVVAARRSC